MGKWGGRIWVTCTTLLILFLGLSSQIYIILPSHLSRQQLLWTLGPFNILLALLLYNYYLCITVNPGVVPKDWQPNESEPLELKPLTHQPRYCRTCKAYKPPRAHHCRTCKRCVLRMDHHCPWVNNCVGHYNYPHFIRFLILVDWTTIWHLTIVSRRVFWAEWEDYYMEEPSTKFLVILVMNYVLCLPTLIAVGLFSLYHIYCLLSNTTTIESWEKEKTATMKRRGRIMEFKYPYHLSLVKNIQSVLGSNPLFWLWPGLVAPGDGLKYPVGKGLDEAEQYTWPPKDPYLSSTSSSTHRDSNSSEIHHRRRTTKPRSKAPYEADDSSTEENGDDTPLAQLVNRGNVKVRRGSEGYEVRPLVQFDRLGEMDRWGDEYQGTEREGEEERYRRYVPESDSEDDDSSGSDR